MTERTYRHIRSGLATGQFRPGTQLSESTISQELGVGRTPVREAFLLLENEGFIEQVPRYGTFVKNPGRHERQSLYELREVLESYAAGKAAEYMNEATITKIGQFCDEMLSVARAIRDKGQATDELLSRGAIADMAFHMLILRACGNPLVIKSVSDLHLTSRIWGSDRGNPHRTSLRDRALSWAEHIRIYRAIKRRDSSGASYWMGVHLRHATVMALEHYDAQCRTAGMDAVGYEWPAAVREAITKLEQFGPDALD